MARLFIAIELPDYVKDELRVLQRSNIPGARRVKQHQMHLTLHFLGEVNESTQRTLQETLSAVQAAPFELRLNGVGQFPPKGKPRVLWVGLEETTALQALYRQLADSLRDIGLAVDDHPYHPHLTLARLKITPPRRIVADFLEKYATFRTQPFMVNAFALFSSNLTPQGPQYTPELIVPLE